MTPAMTRAVAVIDDFSLPAPQASNGAAWERVSDQVMGGVSSGDLRGEVIEGRRAIRLQGDVSLENDGGFLQMALDLAPGGGPVDARGWTGLEIDVFGNGARYNIHLRTADVQRPWQSWRVDFPTEAAWRTHRLPFAGFEAHRIDAPFDLGTLRRVGVVAIGRAFHADVAVGGLRFYA